MKNTQRVIITMLISIILITIVGMYFKIRAINILKLSLSSLVLEILIHYFAYKQNRPQITLSNFPSEIVIYAKYSLFSLLLQIISTFAFLVIKFSSQIFLIFCPFSIVILLLYFIPLVIFCV